MKKLIRLITTLVIITLLLGVCASCAKKDDGDANTTPALSDSSEDSGSTFPEQDEEIRLKPEQKNYGYEYIILSDSNGNSEYPHYINEENKQSGEPIAQALYMRQQVMNNSYGVTLSFKKDADYKNTLINSGAAGEYICDVTMIKAKDTFPLASRGYYYNLLTLQDSLNLEASYWDQRIQKEYRINDMLFTLEGDFAYMDELRTMVVLYNAQVYQDYGYLEKYGTPYSMVENHTWTYGTMMQMIKDLAEDSHADNVMNENDTWGMVSELTAPYYFFLGSGLKTMENRNGELEVLLNDSTRYEQIYNVIEKTMNIVNNKDVLVADASGVITSKDKWEAASDIFEADRALFRTTTLSATTRLREMKSDYGILPIPTFFEDQTEYYCWMSENHLPLAISAFVPNAQVTAEITERLCYHSRYGTDTLYSAFFDRMAYSRLCRTPDDIHMLELVINSKTFDLDDVTKITGVGTQMYSIAQSKNYTALSSTLSGVVTAANSKLDKYLINLIANQIR